MYWTEDRAPAARQAVPEDVVDLAFPIECRTIAVDHAFALAQALGAVLPWLEHDDRCGIHSLHVPESGNGWLRPAGADELLHPSRRIRLRLRLPKMHIGAAQGLASHALDVGGHPMAVTGQGEVHRLSEMSTLFSRTVLAEDDEEPAFLDRVASELVKLGIRPRKVMCGMERWVRIPSGRLRARGVLVADLSRDESFRLQERGLFSGRRLGCGIFVPHKGIQQVSEASSP